MLRENFMSVGTTSACAENTVGASWRPRPSWNYLRVRGEYLRKIVNMHKQMELPPRARRIPRSKIEVRKNDGTTSACAENTGFSDTPDELSGNYLRVRGEYHTAMMQAKDAAELPPRARRIPYMKSKFGVDLGTTSACAENTPVLLLTFSPSRNYLRVRGEYEVVKRVAQDLKELPPRARRIQYFQKGRIVTIGTTSACAENTHLRWVRGIQPWNYLRVRGEYYPSIKSPAKTRELPPRARRIQIIKIIENSHRGTTSACAENTYPCTRGLSM